MNDIFLTDMARAFALFLLAYALFLIYCYYNAKKTFTPRQGDFFPYFLSIAKKLLISKYALGPVALAGIVSLFFAESLPAILTIGGFFMGLLYITMSQRP